MDTANKHQKWDKSARRGNSQSFNSAEVTGVQSKVPWFGRFWPSTNSVPDARVSASPHDVAAEKQWRDTFTDDGMNRFAEVQRTPTVSNGSTDSGLMLSARGASGAHTCNEGLGTSSSTASDALANRMRGGTALIDGCCPGDGKLAEQDPFR